MSSFKIVFLGIVFFGIAGFTGLKSKMSREFEKVSVRFVNSFPDDSVGDPYAMTPTKKSKFWATRSKLIELCREYGVTGPETVAKNALVAYWVVDECNRLDSLSIQVINEKGWRADWAIALRDFSVANPKFRIYVSGLSKNGLRFSSGRVLVSGSHFGTNDKNLTLVVGKLKEFEKSIATVKNSAIEAKLRYIRRVLPQARKHVDDDNLFYYIGTFTSWDGKAPASVWFLQKKHDDALRLEADGCYAGELRAVTSDGQIHCPYDERFWPDTNLEPPYWLVDYPIDGPPRKITGHMVDENFDPIEKVTLEKVIKLNESDAN